MRDRRCGGVLPQTVDACPRCTSTVHVRVPLGVVVVESASFAQWASREAAALAATAGALAATVVEALAAIVVE